MCDCDKQTKVPVNDEFWIHDNTWAMGILVATGVSDSDDGII